MSPDVQTKGHYEPIAVESFRILKNKSRSLFSPHVADSTITSAAPARRRKQQDQSSNSAGNVLVAHNNNYKLLSSTPHKSNKYQRQLKNAWHKMQHMYDQDVPYRQVYSDNEDDDGDDDGSELLSYQAGPTSSMNHNNLKQPLDQDLTPQPQIAQNRPSAYSTQQPKQRGRPKSRMTDPYEFFMNNYYRRQQKEQQEQEINSYNNNNNRGLEPPAYLSTNYQPANIEDVGEHNFVISRRSETFGPTTDMPSKPPNTKRRAQTFDGPGQQHGLAGTGYGYGNGNVNGPGYPTTEAVNSKPKPKSHRRDHSPAFFIRTRSKSRRRDEDDDDLIKRLMGNNDSAITNRKATPFPSETSQGKITIPSVGDPKYGGSGGIHDENAAISPPPPSTPSLPGGSPSSRHIRSSSSNSRRYDTPFEYSGDARPEYEKPGVFSSGMNFLRSLGNSHRRHDRYSRGRIPSPMPGSAATPRSMMYEGGGAGAYGNSALERPVGRRGPVGAGGGRYGGYYDSRGYHFNNQYGRGGYGYGYGNGIAEFMQRLFAMIPFLVNYAVYLNDYISRWPPIMKYPAIIFGIVIGMRVLYMVSLVMEYFASIIKVLFNPFGSGKA